MKLLACAAVALLFLLTSWSTGIAADCAGGWKTIPNYDRGRGTPCEILGLDTHRGTCQPGQEFETLCDDASGGRYRVCRGARSCEGSDYTDNKCKYWDYRYDQPCPPGFINTDCRGECERISTTRPCKNWDYNYNQPCPDGYINFDCSGGCERRYR